MQEWETSKKTSRPGQHQHKNIQLGKQGAASKWASASSWILQTIFSLSQRPYKALDFLSLRPSITQSVSFVSSDSSEIDACWYHACFIFVNLSCGVELLRYIVMIQAMTSIIIKVAACTLHGWNDSFVCTHKRWFFYSKSQDYWNLSNPYILSCIFQFFNFVFHLEALDNQMIQWFCLFPYPKIFQRVLEVSPFIKLLTKV